MRRTWLYSPARLNRKVFCLALSIPLILGSWGSSAFASRGGVEEINNEFTVGFTFKFGNTDQLCSGALISSNLIATARHCVYSAAGEYGTDYIFSAPGAPLDAAINPNIIPTKIKKIFLNPTFKSDLESRVNDIAFLQLDKSLSPKGFLKIASATDYTKLESATVSGYGYGAIFETGASYSIYPRRYSIDIKKLETQTASANAISIFSPSSSACRGDSGGPIVAKLSTGDSVLLGVLSGAADIVENCGSKQDDGNFYMRMTAIDPFLKLVSDIYPPKTYPSPTPLKKRTITCIKGKVTKRVTAINPKCPTGYKKK